MSNSIKQVKKRLQKSFALTSIVSAFVIFFSLALYTILAENDKTKDYLASLSHTAEYFYQYRQSDAMQITPEVNAYYSKQAIPAKYHVNKTLTLDKAHMFDVFEETGFFIYYGQFINSAGKQVDYYLTVGTRDLEFGDDNWEVTVLLAIVFALFLNCIFWFSLQKVFSQLMTPVQLLGRQLQDKQNKSFSLPSNSVLELQQFTERLNHYNNMREEMVKQEMMFAKYTSHEMRTPVAVILGAARLQGMSDKPDFQEKQRLRILTAAENMQETVEVMLNLVKRDNHSEEEDICREIAITELHHLSEFFATKLHNKNLELHFDLDESQLPHINCPEVVLSMLLKNLLSNAIRSTENGSITLQARHNRIAIIDTGQGLKSNDKPDEHGLGLLIVEHLCQRYNWQFSLTNNTDKGCNAQLLLPDCTPK